MLPTTREHHQLLVAARAEQDRPVELFPAQGATMAFYFEEYCLDTARRELSQGTHLVPVEPQVFDLLAFLVSNRERVITKDDLLEEIWGGRVVSESTLTSRINAARRAVDDTGAEQRLIRTIARKGFRFVGTVTTELAGSDEALPILPAASSLFQRVQFCTATDGVRIAYATVGEGLPIVKAGNWLNHLEYDWESPVWSHLLSALASRYRLIRYDARGNGLSDWDVPDISFDALVRDLESVIDTATAGKKFALLGISQGCAACIDYAVRHPDRVSHLILYGGFARGRRKRGCAAEAEKADALMVLMRSGWGQENPAFRQLFTSQFIPDGTADQMRWFNDLQRLTTTPENAARIRYAADEIDVSGLLARVTVPTLVLHCRDDAVQPFEEGRRLAAGIPGSRFVALEGRNHLFLKDEPARCRFLDEVHRFLGAPPGKTADGSHIRIHPNLDHPRQSMRVPQASVR